jgi:hypothetical protein
MVTGIYKTQPLPQGAYMAKSNVNDKYNGSSKQEAGAFIRELMGRQTGDKKLARNLAEYLGVYESYVSQLVNGTYDIRSNHYRLALIIDYFRISEKECRERLGVTKIVTPARGDLTLPKPSKITLSGDFPNVLFLGTVQAMKMMDCTDMRIHSGKSISCPLEVARKYPIEVLFVLRVNGESMIDRDLRKTIPEGAYVLFHCDLEVRHRDIVAAWIPNLGAEGLGVIKEYRQNGDAKALWSYSDEGMRLPASEYPDMAIQGVYLGHWMHHEGRRG